MLRVQSRVVLSSSTNWNCWYESAQVVLRLKAVSGRAVIVNELELLVRECSSSAQAESCIRKSFILKERGSNSVVECQLLPTPFVFVI